MKTKCYSVRLVSLVSISDKAYKATAFDGSTAVIPKSMVFGQDNEVQKSEAHWIAAWILDKKEGFQYSTKKEAWFNESGNMQPSFNVVKHVPAKKESLNNNEIKELRK